MQLGTRFQTFLILSGLTGAFLLISGLAEKPTGLRILLVAGMLAPAGLVLLIRTPLKRNGHGHHTMGRHR